MVQQGVVHDLHAAYVPGRYPVHGAARFKGQGGGAALAAVADCLAEFHLKIVVLHRFQHKIQCLHLVALDGVLGHVGHKDQGGLLILGPQPPAASMPSTSGIRMSIRITSYTGR